MSKKICILTDSLSFGGAEKVAANMTISLKAKGYHVFIVSMINSIDYNYEGELYNFGFIKENCNRFDAFLKFKRFFNENRFDVIIDHRVRNKFFKEVIFAKYVFRNYSVIYCVHNYRLEYYFSFINTPSLVSLSHVKNRKFVSVSNEIRSHLELKLKIKSKTIYNYLIFKDLIPPDRDNELSYQNYIIGVGRLTTIKQFDKLIRSFQSSKLSQFGFKLVILGDGPEKENLKQLISKLKLDDFIDLVPFTKKPYRLISNAKALVLTSGVEGFPMVLLEALALKTPIIAFNCKSGPSEIIINEQNGLLVDNQNEEKLAEALNILLLDDNYYKRIKSNALVGLEKFSEEKVIQKWITLIENQM